MDMVDVILAKALSGSGGGGGIILAVNDGILNASYNQLKTYYDKGIPVFLHDEYTYDAADYYKIFSLFLLATTAGEEYDAWFISYVHNDQFVVTKFFYAEDPDADMLLD